MESRKLMKKNREHLLAFKNGTVQSMTLEQFFSPEFQAASGYWVHFLVEHPQLHTWLKEQSAVDKLLVEAMLSHKVRPRLVEHKDSALLILRVADTLEASEHEELRSLRIYTDANRVISTSLYPLPVIQELILEWKGKTCKNLQLTDLFIDLIVRSIKGVEAILEDVEDRTDLFEKRVLGVEKNPEEEEIASLAIDTLQLRRYLSPQREVLSKLKESEVPWLEGGKKRRVRESYERVCRQLDEVEVLRDRTKIIRDRISSYIAEQVSYRLYIFSVIAAIFLPLSFLTGLLGVNLNGIPGAHQEWGFFAFCGLLTILSFFMFLAFRRLRWI